MKAVNSTEDPVTDFDDTLELIHEVCVNCGASLPEPVTVHWRMDVFCPECSEPDDHI